MRDFFYRAAIKIQVFMQGRNGIDSLNRGLFISYFLLSFFNSMIFSRLTPHLSIIFRIILIVIAIILVSRILSKDLDRRHSENELWLMFTYKFSRKKDLIRQRMADKDHVYRVCPSCNRTIRLKRNKGRHKVDCPKCQKEFSVWIII